MRSERQECDAAAVKLIVRRALPTLYLAWMSSSTGSAFACLFDDGAFRTALGAFWILSAGAAGAALLQEREQTGR